MGYRQVEGAGLRTRHAGTPTVLIKAVPDGPLGLELSYQSEPAAAGREATFTRIRFEDVREYRWIATDQTYFPTNRDDYEFGLIEIVDSEQIDQLLSEGIYGDRPRGQRLGGTTDEACLHHYRLGFDDYGSFDVICLRLTIDSFRNVS